MNISKKALENHDELFDGVDYAPTPDTPSLADTNPEFLNIFLNFAFEEVYDHDTSYDKKLRMIVILALMIAQNTRDRYKVFAAAALNIGVTPAELTELVYHALPYCGVARVFDIIYDTNDVLRAHVVTLPVETKATVTRENRLEKGLETQVTMFGEGFREHRNQAPANEQHVQDFLSANCFGDYYTRGALDLKTRELLTFVFVLSLGGCDPQVKAHVQGNLGMGNDAAFLKETITQLIPYIGYPRALNALQAIRDVSGE